MGQTAFILILPSDEAKGQRLHDLLRERHGHSCRVVTMLEDALNSIRARVPDVVVAVSPVAGEETVQPLAELLDSLAPDATLMALGNDGPPAAPQIRRIRYIALQNPDDDTELVDPIGEAARKAVARREDRLLRQSVAAARIESFEGIVGVSPQMQKIVERIKKAARNKLTVLILGETGTGKDLIARAIHRRSDRAKRPFKSLNCAGLSETLIESELFGHVRGSFTGAVADRKGYFAAADGGTLFLDEIGDMPMRMQAKLLRVLELREFTPVGSTDLQRVDVRLIAATNTNLRERVQEHEFRDDLFYRLNQWVIEVPPLRERRQDIPLLAHHLLREASEQHGLNVDGISSEAMNLLTKYYWPGNVRELKNVIESVACEVEDRQLEADDLPEHIRGARDIVPVSASGLVGLTMEQVERMMIERTLQATEGNREQAAKMLNIGTRTLYRKIKEYDLQ
jgi:two-component system response regulator HydG